MIDPEDVFEEKAYTRSDTFLAIYEAIEEMDDETKEELLRKVLFDLPEEEREHISQNMDNLAIYFQAFAEQQKKEKNFYEEVLIPAYEQFNKMDKAVHIRGLEV